MRNVQMVEISSRLGRGLSTFLLWYLVLGGTGTLAAEAAAGPNGYPAISTSPTPASLTRLPIPWGAYGHDIVSRVAFHRLPPGMPDFFMAGEDQLAYLGPEPDRWRSRDLKEMDDAWEFDHYIDMENVPPGALEASDRYEFIAALYEAGIKRPQQFVGFLPWRMLEVYQRLKTELAIWRNTDDPRAQRFVEARVLNDAGILGHYAADAAQPHHTTIHFNGWAEDAPNPRGFTTSRDFHSRFESAFTQAHVTLDDVVPRVSSSTPTIPDIREAIWAHVQASNAQVERQYNLEQKYGFDPEAPANQELRDFVSERLAAGAEMLRALWWSAWVESEALAAERRARGWDE